MIFYNSFGAKKKLSSPHKYKINWDAGCRSKLQKEVKDLLYPFWFSDVVFEELPVVGTRMTIDFYNASKKIALEVDGAQHYQYNKHFHAGSRQNYLKQLCRDNEKEVFCEKNDITMIRVLQSDSISIDLLKELGAI
jgi:very-short-patch-repair endonuclease